MERLREVRERLLARPELFPVAIGPAEGRALLDLARAERARRTLEVGLGHGLAALWICEALVETGGRHVAIDPYQRTHFEGGAVAALEEAGVGALLELHEEESQLVLPRLLAEGRSFDLAFLDGNHRFEAVFLDLYYAGRLLGEGRAVFVDDVQLPGVRKALDFFAANLGWRVEGGGDEGEAHAWAVLRTGPAAALARPFRAFVDF